MILLKSHYFGIKYINFLDKLIVLKQFLKNSTVLISLLKQKGPKNYLKPFQIIFFFLLSAG